MRDVPELNKQKESRVGPILKKTFKKKNVTNAKKFHLRRKLENKRIKKAPKHEPGFLMVEPTN